MIRLGSLRFIIFVRKGTAEVIEGVLPRRRITSGLRGVLISPGASSEKPNEEYTDYDTHDCKNRG